MERKKLTICNDRVIADTTAMLGETKKTVEMVIGFVGPFINSKISEGSLESIRIPRFGLFRAKLRSVQYKSYRGTAMPTTTVRVAGGETRQYGRKPDENQHP